MNTSERRLLFKLGDGLRPKENLDPQCKALSEATRQAARSFFTVVGKEWPTLSANSAKLEAYAFDAMQSAGLKGYGYDGAPAVFVARPNSDVRRIALRLGVEGASGGCWDKEVIIVFPRRNKRVCQWVLLHEIAHACTSDKAESHGPEFAANFVRLVRAAIGDDAADTVVRAFHRHQVEIEGTPRPAPSGNWQKIV